MIFPRFLNRVGKGCTLVAATLILPVLSYAGTDNGNGNNGQNNGNQNGHNLTVPAVREANAGWVLIPFFRRDPVLFGTTTPPRKGGVRRVLNQKKSRKTAQPRRNSDGFCGFPRIA